MSKALEALEITKDQLNGLLPKGLTTSMKCNMKTIEKALKALEIIKERVVDVGYVIDCESEPEYLNRMCHRVYAEQNDFIEKPAYKRLSKEEFDLLKEVLL